MGYKAPPVPSLATPDFAVLDDGDARAGGVLLDRALGGLNAVRGTSGVQVNVLAHSYGTTTAAYALTAPGVHVDTFVSVASAGLPAGVDRATDIHAAHVYAGQARNVIPGLETGKGANGRGPAGTSAPHTP